MRYLLCRASAQNRHLPFLAQSILGKLLKLSIKSLNDHMLADFLGMERIFPEAK